MVPMTQKSTNLYQVKVDGQVVARTTRKVYAEKRAAYERGAHPQASVAVVSFAEGVAILR